MSNYLYYPNSSSSLVDIGNSVCGMDMEDSIKDKLFMANPHIKQPNKKHTHSSPIVLPGATGPHCSAPICSPKEHDRVSAMSHQVGGAATIALAELVDELKVPRFASDMNTFGGNGIGAAAQAANFIVSDIAEYDRLLKEYYDLRNHRATLETLIRKESELKRAFGKMNDSLNKRGQHILHKHTTKTKQVLTSTGKVGYESIPISNEADVQRLANLAKFGKVAGPGFILLDGYFRYDKVVKMYKQNNANWKREAIVQTAGFASGILAGAAIVFMVGFAPVGLVVGIVAAGTMAVVADKVATGGVGMLYDGLTH